MTLPHLHLLLNHVPTVGTVIAVALLLLSYIRRNVALRHVSLELFAVIALLTLPAYLSGVGTQLAIQELPGVSAPAIERHHDAAILASIFMLITGSAAWLALWQFRRAGQPSGATMTVVGISALVTLALMAQAATMGGEIRHPEIIVVAQEGVEPSSPGPDWLSATAIAAAVNQRVWLWPALETLHFVGLWMLFGVLLLVNLRVLGMMPQVSYAALHRLLPWAMLALVINTITGIAFVVAAGHQYVNNVAFFWKIGLLLLAGFNLIYLTAFEGPWRVEAGQRAPLRVQLAALSSIVLWVGVMYFGRMLPFIGNAF